ncbi:MAG: RagB/SusD family nutrient uptake outer membrane protein [Phocaeicola sp.]
MKTYNFLISILFLLTLSACFELNKVPQGVLSTTTAFTSTSEIERYLNQFYETAPRTQSNNVGSATGIAFGDMNSDNLIGNVINTRLAGELALSNSVSLTNYTYIRNLNFLINNMDNCQESGERFNHCKGEAHFFRAWYYYQLFVNYGPLSWVTEVLDPSQEQMQIPRHDRTVVADNILADLDIAIMNLSTQNSNASMRVHKDVAYALKSEVALFEGTWEKYHKDKGDEFYDKGITDSKIEDYLQQAVDAARNVIDRGIWGISSGDITTAYRDLFINLDLTGNNEVLWWKKYNIDDNIGHSVTRFLNRGGGITGVSASLIDDYLTIDGRPFLGDERDQTKLIYGDELQPSLRDPRLSQTVCLPGQTLRPNNDYIYSLPPLDGNSYHQNTTGFSVLKYVEFNPVNQATIDGEGKSQAPAIQFRYADILLNYAEALAELDGAANAQIIVTALNPLRLRVGMPDVDFDREYNSDPAYPFAHLNKYIQAVRRERRIEKALEGRRLEDILRWAAADVLIKGQTPKGALFIGSNLENSYVDLVFDQTSGNNLYLTGSSVDAKRYVIPFNNISYPNGWDFDLNRDYLLPIQPRMLSLTNNLWTQNPGW